MGSKNGWPLCIISISLFVGKGGMSNTEYRTMFALWCAVKSPLMLGSDLSKVDINSETFEVKSNHNLNN